MQPLTDPNSSIVLIDHMGDDSAIVNAARISYGKDKESSELTDSDRKLIRYLLRHQHTSPFELVEFKFMVQVPMDCWRQWVRHRTASINEYSTRYMEALDFFQVTHPQEWRLQSQDNKQGSSGFLSNDFDTHGKLGPGIMLSESEQKLHEYAKDVYKERIALGIAKEQARKDLPLSTYTRAIWKCDLHNIFNFLRLRMDPHAQYEIRRYAECMFELIKPVVPVACEAFEDYVLHSRKFSRMEMELLRKVFNDHKKSTEYSKEHELFTNKPTDMSEREWKEFLAKLC